METYNNAYTNGSTSSADPVIFIVKNLNKLFGTNLTLVDFDEKSEVELLQTLNDVLTEIEPTMRGEVRDEDREERLTKVCTLLQMLKYAKDPSELRSGLASGDENAYYPLLHWLLERLELHKKRAYVAKFLYPVDIPAEFVQQDETLGEKYQHYKRLQSEFKKAHQAVEVARKQPGARTGEIRSEIASFEDESKQLQSKIEKLQKQNADTRDFDELLRATNALRVQQDEDAKLRENMRRQKGALGAAEARKKEAWNRLQTLRNATNGSRADAEGLLKQLQEEVSLLEARVLRDLPKEIDAKKSRVAQLSGSKAEPFRTAEDLEDIRARTKALEARVKDSKEDLEKTIAAKVCEAPKLATARQHALIIAKKLDDKRRDVDKVESDREKLAKDIDRKETALAEAHREGASYFMTREEFKQFGAQLRERTAVYKDLKSELGTIRAEAVTLHRTEQILRAKVDDVDTFLEHLEKKRGVAGYRDAEARLEQAAARTADVDLHKEKTLEDISETVKLITAELKDKKKALAPQIHKLKEVRGEFQRLESDFLTKKSTYDKIAVTLDVERQQLERDCDDLQEDALREESRFHYLNCLLAVSKANLERVDDEQAWKQGQGRGLLPNFRSYEELYHNKLAQQQAFSDQLRKQRALIEQTETSSMHQRHLYLDLKALLDAKLNAHNNLARADLNAGDTFHSFGNANVFQLSGSTS